MIVIPSNDLKKGYNTIYQIGNMLLIKISGGGSSPPPPPHQNFIYEKKSALQIPGHCFTICTWLLKNPYAFQIDEFSL